MFVPAAIRDLPAFLAECEPDHGTERAYSVRLSLADGSEEVLTVTAPNVVKAKSAAQMRTSLRALGQMMMNDVVRIGA